MSELNTLHIYINKLDDELKSLYIQAIEKHNIQSISAYPNAGFDLFNPDNISSEQSDQIYKLNTFVVGAMFDKTNKPKSYYLYPRSSISKTFLRLANSVGIIDSGYRGNLIGMFDILKSNVDQNLEKYSRVLQICSGDLEPFLVKLVSNIDELGLTERGDGGFGSTGK
jgi:dUTP pyrophosphatase